MDGAVVFDAQPLTLVEEIGPARESAGLVVDPDLSLRPRQSAEDDEHA